MKNSVYTIVGLLLLASGISQGTFGAVTPLDAPPPIPEKLAEQTQGSVHPFLLATRDEFRQGRKNMREDLYKDLWREFKQRAEGYTKDSSPWYIGAGPFAKDASFHPQFLNARDLRFYADTVCEMLAYAGFESERWSINLLQDEALHLLEELDASTDKTGEIDWTARTFTPEEAYLVGLLSMTYDFVYNRIDTAKRHVPNQRLKRLRDQLSEYCAQINPAEIPPRDLVIFGTGLGMSTLLCLSVYPYEWKTEASFTAQSFLPDLYRAVSLTRQGMDAMVTENLEIHTSLEEMETVFLTAIPWIECMNRLGYPMAVNRGTYDRIFRALSKHRVPETAEVIVPYYEKPLRDPWLPQTTELLWKVNPGMYSDEEAAGAAVDSVTAAAEVSSATIENATTVLKPSRVQGAKPRGVPERFAGRSRRFTLPGKAQKNISLSPFLAVPNPIPVETVDTGRVASLREILEKFSFPRPEPVVPLPGPVERIRLDAGWTRPAGLELPPMWGGLIQLAAQDNPASGAQELWDEFGTDADSHPYAYLFQKPVKSTRILDKEKPVLLQYSEQAFSLLDAVSLQDTYSLASQAAKATQPMATYTIDHESFLLSENGVRFRWMNEAPAAVESASAETCIANGTGDSLHTDLFSWWKTHSPTGSTQILRKHWEGVGGAYSVVAHFPDRSPSSNAVKNVVFRVPDQGKSTLSEDHPDRFQIHTANSDQLHNALNVYDLQKMRRAKRAGEWQETRAGILNILFSPEAVENVYSSEGALGSFVDTRLRNPRSPFFYIAAVDQSGHEMFQTKYEDVPLDGLRVLEWKEGLDLIAIRTEGEINNPFVHSDADMVLVSWDKEMKGIFYTMIHGTFLRVKFSPNQAAYTLLADTKGRRLNAAWSTRRIFTSEPPAPMSVFYAPGALGFECPGTVIEYGLKGRQVTVWGHKDAQ